MSSFRTVVFILLVMAARSAMAQTVVRVTIDRATIWSAPSLPSVALTTVKTGTLLEVLGRVGSWYRVRLPEDPTRSGYIQVRQVEETAESVRAPQPGPGARPRIVPRRGPPRRSFVFVSAGYVPTSLDFDSSATFNVFREEGSRTTRYNTRRTPLFDAGYGLEFRPGLLAGAAISWTKGDTSAEIEQKVPHPFFFEQMRTLNITQQLPREEIALHLQIGGLAPLSRRIYVVLAAGPSMFKLKEDVVTDVSYTDTYPFDSIEFERATIESLDRTFWGGHVQANVVMMIGRQVGVDGLLRYSRASSRFSPQGTAEFTVPAGGAQVALGFRAQF